MQWNGAIGAIARCKRVSTVYAPKRRSRHVLHSICGEKPKAKDVTRPFKFYIRRVQDERSPAFLLQSLGKPGKLGTIMVVQETCIDIDELRLCSKR